MFLRKSVPIEELEENEKFPQLMMEPWRVAEMVEEESFLQRTRLFRVLSISKISIVCVISLMLLFFSSYKFIQIFTLDVLYIAANIFFMRYSRANKEKIISIAFWAAILDIFAISILLLKSGDNIEFSLLFFSIIISSMMLPLMRTLIIGVIGIFISAYGLLSFKINAINFYGFWEKQSDILNILSNNKEIRISLLLLFFSISLPIAVSILTSWSFRNEVRAQFRYKQLRQVLSFNTSIIEHLKSGVLVLSGAGNVLSINQRALEMLAMNDTKAINHLSDISTTLLKIFFDWTEHGIEDNSPYKHNNDAEDVSISFTSFGKKGTNIVMMTLESINESIIQAREARLSSLGKLTAGVAHEIRNPLSSINSAAELLIESTDDEKIIKLSNMILSNTKRTNQIIGDILGLFRETRQNPELIEIDTYLKNFCQNFSVANKNEEFKILVVNNSSNPKLYIKFDDSQLDLILWNISQNALKYARVADKTLVITIALATGETGRNIYIDIIDNGAGIKPENKDRIFEPFFAGHAKGTGLGLYLVKEICSANNANIFLVHEAGQGAHFRIKTKAYYSKTNKVLNHG